ncbi:hypothetical protein [Petralouisia muris]|uniref:hypothetical protein n=1 Tax=Petralouisia muris TaxID=3032872 RepID=UPI0014415E89|nr:hypothetical protein [Petralouisia muris]
MENMDDIYDNSFGWEKIWIGIGGRDNDFLNIYFIYKVYKVVGRERRDRRKQNMKKDSG